VPLVAHLPRPRDLVRFGPHNDSHWVALRAGVSVGLPLVLLTATGHRSWLAYAAFGAFTSLYGRGEGYRRRMHTQLAAALTLVLAVGFGTAVSAVVPDGPLARGAIVGAAVLTAVLGSLVGDATGWRPAGPLFSVFAVATCAGIPAVPADIPAAFAVASVSAAFAVVVGLGGALSPTRRARERASSPPFGVRRLVEESAVRRHAVRYGIAALAAGAVATVAGIGHPSWAMVAAVVPLAVSDTPGQLLRASHRLGGTAVGLVVAAGLFALHPAGWELVIVVVVLQTVAELFVVRNYGFAMIFITPLALLMNLLVGTVPTDVLLRDRALETLIGAVVGIVVALVSTRRAIARGVVMELA
jgi:hypothetical protein